MLISRPDATRGRFGPQSEAVAIVVGKGIHLFFDNIGLLPDGSAKKLSPLNDGRPNLPVTIATGYFSHDGLYPLPGFNLPRQKVIHPSD